jgi:hypothetical protein
LQVGTKLSGFAASLAFGGLQLATGSPQSGLLALIAQLAIGWWLIRRGNPLEASTAGGET